MIEVKQNRKELEPLVYFQAKSEIDDTTSEHASYEVYFSKEKCQNAFPDSEIVKMEYGDIELPFYIDIVTIETNNKGVAEAFVYASIQSFETMCHLDDNDNSIFESDYVIAIIENNKDEEESKRIMLEWLAYVGMEDEDDKTELERVLAEIKNSGEVTVVIKFNGFHTVY